MLFCKVNLIELARMNQLLALYEPASLFFSKSTIAGVGQQIFLNVGLQATNSIEKYLGMPFLIGRSKSHAFQNIVNRIYQKMENLKVHFFITRCKRISTQGYNSSRANLHKCVFCLSKVLCKRIQNNIARFWWDSLKWNSLEKLV